MHKKHIQLYIYSTILIFSFQQNNFTQENTTNPALSTQSILKTLIENWFATSTNKEWLLEVNGTKLPSNGIEVGLENLEENLKKSDASSLEKKQIKQRFIQTYIDQSAILVSYYQELLKHPDLDILLQEFLRQATTQVWLEDQMKQDPNAIVPTQDEINKYYQENSERLLRLGLSAAQIKTYTEQELRQNKLQEWTMKKLGEFKEKNPATINPKLKKKYNI